MKRILTVVVAVGLLAAGCRQGAAPAPATPPAPPTSTIQPAPAPAPAPAPGPGPSPSPANPAAPAQPAGIATLEVDLNGDGRNERIEGKLGEWHAHPLHLYNSEGREIVENAFNNDFSQGRKHRLTVATIPGMDRPALVYETGKPGAMNYIEFRWLREQGLVSAWGWHPKITAVHAAAVSVEPDGTIVATNIPAEMGGYTWIRRYRITADANAQAGSSWFYKAELQEQKFSAGAYPTEPEALLTAAFIARWYGLDADLERYMPDPAVRSRFKAAEMAKPGYVPIPVRVGKLTIKKGEGSSTDQVTRLESAPPGPDGKAEFLAAVQEYEGGSHYAGPVTFGKAQDGRLVIQQLEITHTGWEY